MRLRIGATPVPGTSPLIRTGACRCMPSAIFSAWRKWTYFAAGAVFPRFGHYIDSVLVGRDDGRAGGADLVVRSNRRRFP